MKTRYAVFGEMGSSNDFFKRVRSLPFTGNVQRGELAVAGKKLRFSANRPLGTATDLLVTELDDTEHLDLVSMFPLLNIDEDVEGRMALFAPLLLVDAMARAGGGRKQVTVDVVDEHGAPLAGMRVEIIFTITKAGRVGAEATTDSNGRARLPIAASRTHALFVTTEPAHTYWPATLQRVKLGSSPRLRLRCPSIASHPRDAIASLYSAVNPLDGHGVRVAIVDGGVGPHKELRLGAPGKTFGSSKSVGDNGVGHGTHVAGIIRRLAPAADLRSYRVFDDGSMATHGAIVAAAVQQAIRDGVQVINLSITFPQHSPVLESALNLARVKGVICVCAAGNDAGPVMVPAKYTAAVAVAACGQADWPTGALDRELLARAGTKTTGLHAAAFTCFGREITFTAPGVGLVSAYPKNRRAVMSGTSMSAPVVTGLLAKALSQGTPAMPALVAAAKRLGVDSKYQGHGVPFP